MTAEQKNISPPQKVPVASKTRVSPTAQLLGSSRPAPNLLREESAEAAYRSTLSRWPNKFGEHYIVK